MQQIAAQSKRVYKYRLYIHKTANFFLFADKLDEP